MSKGIYTTDWQARARTSLRNQRAAWLGSITAGVVGGVLVGAGAHSGEGLARSILLSGGGAALVTCLVWGTIVYMRVIDEQERAANLWSCYVGMVVYLTLFITKYCGERLALALPITDTGIFTATMVTVLVVFAWRRFF